MSFLHEALIFLTAAVVSVPVFKRLGLGSVLGYLAAGVVIGPWGAKLITDVENILHFSELGVVLLLFLIGLELRPSRLWQLRRTVFGLGGVQVVGTGAVLAGVGAVLGLPPATAIIAGLGLSLSSTAFALQLLTEKNELPTEHGQAAFGILLFQDLAVIPLLALLPFLGERVADAASQSGWVSAARGVGVLLAVVVGGRYVLRPVLRFVASLHSQELFTATALLVVVGTALLMAEVGLSMALGAFLAGVLLADSEYRHELEADIEPFKGLLLGLFFIAVGMSVNLGLLASEPARVVALVAGLVVIKALVLFLIGWRAFRSQEPAWSLAICISQGGEFAFVLFGLAVGFRVMDEHLQQLLVVVVSLSMAVTPLLFAAYDRGVRPRLRRTVKRDFDVSPEEDQPVIIAGLGRVGQVVARLLRARRIGFTALDINAEHIAFIAKFGNTHVYYGDASRLDLLRAARADKARVFVLAIDDIEASVRTAETVRQHFPHLTIFARARNRQHAYRLLSLGVTHIMRETFAGSLELTGEVLQALGFSFSESKSSVERFRQHDDELLRSTYQHMGDTEKMAQLAAQARKELEQLFDQDARDRSL